MGNSAEKSGAAQEIKKFLNRLLLKDKDTSQPAVIQEIITSSVVSDKKKAALEKACALLLMQKDILTSGKLEFIGLTAIRSHLGKEWAGLSKIVYAAAEEAIQDHLRPGDMSLLYNEDTYVLIFGTADRREAQATASAIAEQIRANLFASAEDKLKPIDIRPSICQFKTSELREKPSTVLIATLAGEEGGAVLQEKPFSPAQYALQVKPSPLQRIPTHDSVAVPSIDAVDYVYLPLWDTAKQALTTFVCALGYEADEEKDLARHLGAAAGKTSFEKLLFDIRTLDTVDVELQKREEEGRRLLVGCPVHYETLFIFDNYEKFRQRLAQMSEERRKYLILLVMNDLSVAPVKDGFWFATPLQAFCRELMVEIPLVENVNFQQLRDSGVTTVGVRLNKDAAKGEKETIDQLNDFSIFARAAGMTKIFLLDVPSLSLTTFAVCAGFDYLGGPAIHEPVKKPDHVYRYRHADLLAELL
jgi:hypothetical protein